MKTHERGTCRALFESVSDSGTRWLFVMLGDDGWAITRNGVRVAIGTTDRRSLQGGVEKFATLTRSVAGVAPCDPVVQKHLDRIESEVRSAGACAAES